MEANNRHKPKTRNVGSAQSRYVDLDKISERRQLQAAILGQAKLHHKNFELTGWTHEAKKAERLEKQALRIRYCGYEYVVLRCSDCEGFFMGPSRCESRICVECARKYSMRISKNKEMLLKMLQPSRGRRLMMLTVTKKANTHRYPTSSDLKSVFKCFRKLMNRLYPKKHGCGGFAVIEIGQKNDVIHIHAIVYGKFIYQAVISKLWLELSGDSSVVLIKEVRGASNCLNYIIKYISKPPQYSDPTRLAAYLDALTGVRRIHTYGIFYNYPICRKQSLGCPLCGSTFLFVKIDGGLAIPATALFFDEAIRNVSVN